MDQQNNATTASSRRSDGSAGSMVAAATAQDWAATAPMNHVPFAVAVTGRAVLASTAVQGTT